MPKFDSIAYFEDRQFEFHLAGEKNVTRGWVNIPCPFPGCGDPSWHCGINLESEMYNCYICGAKGHLSKLVAVLEGCSMAQANTILSKHPFLGVEDRDEYPYKDPRKITQARPQNERIWPKEATDLFPDLHRNYLLSRNFDPDLIIPKYKLRACLNLGQYKFRIIIPYFLEGRLISFSSRDVTGKAVIRYKDLVPELSIVPVKRTLYNVDSVKDKVIIVEGPIGVWRMGDGCVATSTSNFNDDNMIQAKHLSARGVKAAFIMYDAEEQAQRRAEQMAGQLTCWINHVEVIALGHGDPGEMTDDEANHLRKEVGL